MNKTSETDYESGVHTARYWTLYPARYWTLHHFNEDYWSIYGILKTPSDGSTREEVMGVAEGREAQRIVRAHNAEIAELNELIRSRERKPDPKQEDQDRATWTELTKTVHRLCEAIDPKHTHGPETEKIVEHQKKLRVAARGICNVVDLLIGRSNKQYCDVIAYRNRIRELLDS